MTRYTPEQRWDHARDLAKHEWRPGDPLPLDQRCALAKLIGECEAIAASGTLAVPAEQSLRAHVAATLSAFNMPSKENA